MYYRAAEHPPEVAAPRLDGWRAVGPLAEIVVPGSHLGMMAEPHVQILAARLAAHLASA